jgi:NitT/TauT family transport system permease protein
VLFAVLWQAVAALVDNKLYLPSLGETLTAGVALVRSGLLAADLWVSLTEAGLGYGLALAVGLMLGAAIARFPVFDRLSRPWLSALTATPLIALGPMFILWFGIGLTAKVAVVFSVCVFPIVINTARGLAAAPENLVEAARAFDAGDLQVFTKVRFPYALPYVIVGLRLAGSYSLIGIVVGEFFGATQGVGYLIFNAAQTFATPDLFVGIAVLAIGGVLIVESLTALERKLAPWRKGER